jgi:uracil phosphoribosyltransferase
LARWRAPQISGKKLCLVSILRAGNGMLDGMLQILPQARVGHVGLYRDPATLVPVEYYFKVPDDIADRLSIVVDPMLATGHSAAAALTRLKGSRRGDDQVRVPARRAPRASRCCRRRTRTCRSSLRRSTTTSTITGYIIPGLGDAGDRMFGTK